MPEMIEKNCSRCGSQMTVRLADHKRGWGKYCSKSCKAVKQSRDTGISGPHYKAERKTVKQMKSGDYARSKLMPWQRRAAHNASPEKTDYLRNNPRVIDVEYYFDGYDFVEKETFFANFSNQEDSDI